MATEAIIHFGRERKLLFSGPYLEIGSKIQPGYINFSPKEIHDHIDDTDWIGIDIEAGLNVDKIVDLSILGIVEELGWKGKFGTIHCHCIMEHVPHIFNMATNIQNCLKEGGNLFLSVPFAWRIHRIPVDMWRFTPQSIDFLFPLLNFKTENCAFSTRHPRKLYSISKIPELPLGTGLRKLGYCFSFLIRLLRKAGLDHGYFNQRALLLESNLMMIGVKKNHPTYNFFPSPISL